VDERAVFFAAPVARLFVDRVAVPLLFAAAERLAPLAEDFARVVLAFLVVDLRPPDLVERAPELAAADRPPLLEPPPEEPPSSAPQRPERTRCAASATASAMIEPSRVALDTAAVAALLAVSAASSPASRIFRRAAGLALIAAAAAARPAASISRLIATFAILSTVVSLEFEEDFLPDFAIFFLPVSKQRHSKAVTVPYRPI
jgi:hypothetical protein